MSDLPQDDVDDTINSAKLWVIFNSLGLDLIPIFKDKLFKFSFSNIFS